MPSNFFKYFMMSAPSPSHLNCLKEEKNLNMYIFQLVAKCPISPTFLWDSSPTMHCPFFENPLPQSFSNSGNESCLYIWETGVIATAQPHSRRKYAVSTRNNIGQWRP
jgi:hypothetical protein